MDPRLKVLQRAKPMGGGGANIGIEAADSAEWVAFLDSDDVWAPTKLERQLGALALKPRGRLVGHGVHQYRAETCVRSSPYASPPAPRALAR